MRLPTNARRVFCVPTMMRGHILTGPTCGE
jgi:hypothetical protein